jgi:hypothetical protein
MLCITFVEIWTVSRTVADVEVLIVRNTVKNMFPEHVINLIELHMFAITVRIRNYV